MPQFIKFYFTSMLNMFRTLIHPSSGACDFSIVSPHWLCVLVSMCVGVSVWLVGVVSVWQAETQLQPVFKENTVNNLMIFERRIMRKIFGPTRTDDGYWRIKTNQETNEILKGQNIIRLIKKQRLNWLGHVEHTRIIMWRR